MHRIYFELIFLFVINDIHESLEHKACIILIGLTKFFILTFPINTSLTHE